MKEIGFLKKNTSKHEPAIGRGKCPQTGSNCGFVRKTCKVYCWLK